MKTPRFLIEEKIQDVPEITVTNEALLHQMINVLRLHEGDPIILLDGNGGVYNGRVKILLKKESIISKESVNFFSKENESSLRLALAILKKDKYEWVLQKCTELGVSQFVPIVSRRTEKLGLNLDRAKLVVKEAVEQSERAFVPDILEPIDLGKYLEKSKQENSKSKMIYLDLVDQKLDVSQFFSEKDLTVFVGPEGGWSEEDREIFSNHGVVPFSINEYVLRAETAAISVVASLAIR